MIDASTPRPRRWRLAVVTTALASALASPGGAFARAREPVEVDLQLVLAVDVSDSMDEDEQRLQREGYLEAIVSKPVLDAIRRGDRGRIAVAYVEWSGAADQRTVVHWSLIDGPESARAFADKLGAVPLHRAARTSISGALEHAAATFAGSGFASARRVIDISGDGPNNDGPAVDRVRDEVLAQGVVINGLPLNLKRSTYATAGEISIEDYYRECVIGGDSSFMLPISRLDQFSDTIKTKLVREIASTATGRDAAPALRLIAASDLCRTGGRLWGD